VSTAIDRPRHGIRGELVYLRPLEPDDAATVHRWYEDDEFRRLMGDLPMSLAARRAGYERGAADFDPGTTDVFRFVICRLEDGVPVGRTDLFSIDRTNGSAAFGIGIGDRAARGHGYGSDAVNALVDFAFGELRLERVWLSTDEENAAAQGTYRRCGFVEEARRRRAFVDRGRLIDEVRMSLLREEWEALPRRRSWALLEDDPG
jgi:RimJ/RimL family protein N-acetyltransferase